MARNFITKRLDIPKWLKTFAGSIWIFPIGSKLLQEAFGYSQMAQNFCRKHLDIPKWLKTFAGSVWIFPNGSKLLQNLEKLYSNLSKGNIHIYLNRISEKNSIWKFKTTMVILY
jgi:hypothetical protein